MQRTDNPITDGVIWRQLIRFFLPIFLGSLFQQLYSTADAIIVGWYAGKSALAAIESTGSMLHLLPFLFVGISTGAAILIAQQHGARQYDAVAKTTHTALVFAALGGAALTGLGVALLPMGLRLMQVPNEIAEEAHTYALILFCGMIPALLYNMVAGILRAIGDTRRPLYFLILSTLLNVALDLLFVAGLKWGVAGAAVATVMAQSVSAVLSLMALARSTQAVRLMRQRLRLTASTLAAILRAGLPIGLQSCMYPIANMMVQSNVNTFGTNTIAAWAVCGKVDLLFWLIVDAIAMSNCTFVAQNYGAGQLYRAKKSVNTSMVISLLILIPISLAFYLFSVPLSRIFIQDEAVVAESAALLRFLSPFYPVFVFGELFSGAIRGSGETLRPMLVTLLGTCVLRVLWVLFAVPLNPNIFTLSACYPISWAVTGAIFLIYYRRHTRHWRLATAG